MVALELLWSARDAADFAAMREELAALENTFEVDNAILDSPFEEPASKMCGLIRDRIDWVPRKVAVTGEDLPQPPAAAVEVCIWRGTSSPSGTLGSKLERPAREPPVEVVRRKNDPCDQSSRITPPRPRETRRISPGRTDLCSASFPMRRTPHRSRSGPRRGS